MIYRNCNVYIGGKYAVYCRTINDKGFHTVCDTEQEAREFGNEQWKKPYIISIYITKMRFYKKRRNSLLIAEATKKGHKKIFAE